MRPQDGSYCAARNRYNLAPYFPCGAQRYTRSSAGLQAGLVQGPRRGPLYPPSLESICRGLETHVRPLSLRSCEATVFLCMLVTYELRYELAMSYVLRALAQSHVSSPPQPPHWSAACRRVTRRALLPRPPLGAAVPPRSVPLHRSPPTAVRCRTTLPPHRLVSQHCSPPRRSLSRSLRRSLRRSAH